MDRSGLLQQGEITGITAFGMTVLPVDDQYLRVLTEAASIDVYRAVTEMEAEPAGQGLRLAACRRELARRGGD